MTFYINQTNGTQLTTIADGTINNTSTSITLVGKNFPTYGQILNQNLVQMMENFAYGTSPSNPLVGQLWYDSSNNVLKYYRGGANANYWQVLTNLIYSSTTPNTPQQSDLWWDSSSQQLKFYDNLKWITVGPQTSTAGSLKIPSGNSFNVTIGSNTVFNINNNGYSNTPYNPVFQAVGRKLNATFTGSGLATPTVWIPQTTSINIGSCYNTTTGAYTCPVDGIYQVSATVASLGGVGLTRQVISWWHNYAETNVSASAKHDTATGYVIPMTASGYIQCSMGDIIQLQAYADNSGVIDYNYSSMSIRLAQ